ncbi:MAG: hypothetical protein HQL32_05505 [Planctomycetes bacterium]|nr:hypothetical protein [Planctomycetota bacterium]
MNYKLDLETLALRSKLLKQVRDFFYSRDFLEVNTPALVPLPSLEPHLIHYPVQIEDSEKAYLISSPEFSHKKILSTGAQRIFEIAHCFRADERGEWHSREFLMLEWYVRSFTLADLLKQCEDFLRELLPEENQYSLITMEEWFHRNYGHGYARCDLESSLVNKGVENVSSMNYDELFFRLFLPTESSLVNLGVVFLTHYPEELRSYAKVIDGKAARFEVYIHGVEVGNAYEEEKDPETLRGILENERSERRAMARDPLAIDEDFLGALSQIPEPISGIAMGLDRIMALVRGDHNLCSISPFPQRS